MLKKFNKPHLLFFPLTIFFVFAVFLVDKYTAAIMIGNLLGFTTDPAILITGLVLGILGRTYKQFSLILYPTASLVTIILTILFINPWQIEVSGQSVPLWIYIYRVFTVIIISHIVFSIKKEVSTFRREKND